MIDEAYESFTSVKDVAKKYDVPIGSFTKYIELWEKARGIKYVNPQIRLSELNCFLAVNSYIDNPKMGIAYWAKFYSTDRHTMCKHHKIKEYRDVA